ncbi:MAG: sulfur carrier protein ThiS [Chloroflexi bacterium]|nr:sulfur carrier protein ThiS [Chloroflexota bacterium]
MVRGLHVISDRRLTGEAGLVSALVEAAAGGACAVHLREPDLPARRQYELGRELRTALPSGVQLFLNDRLDLALAVGADGVHLPTTGLPTAVVRRLAPGLIVGRSVHLPDEVDRDADYLLVGTIYPSRSHPGGPVGGPELVRAIRALTNQPIIAIGGITAERVSEVRAAGADGVAVISAVLGQADRRAAAARLQRALGETTMIEVQLNGKRRTIPAGMTVAQLLDSLGVDHRIVAVELGGEIIDREQFGATIIPDGAIIEVVRMIGGG